MSFGTETEFPGYVIEFYVTLAGVPLTSIFRLGVGVSII